MHALIRSIFAFVLAAVVLTPAARAAEPSERRFGLVIGNAEYPSGTLPTAANDAGLIAQTLQAAGFDVIGARDLDGDSLRRTFRDFADKVAGAGPDAVAFVYLNGHGLQYEGDNYFAGIDSKIERDVDVPSHALRVNDFLRPLASLKPKALIVVMDTARENPYARTGNPLAGGMALVEPTPGTLYAFNAAPGTIAKTDTEAYGVYAQSLAEMIREGGLPINTLFDRVRLRVNEASEGASLPWHASKIDVPFEFFERADDAPKPEASHQVHSSRRAKPIRAFDEAQDAYFAALERDTLTGYIDFLDAYPDHRLSKRVQAIVASRREATTWRRTRNADTPNAYWTYLDLYPDGPHAWDARRRLDYLTAPPLPPPSYTRFIYDDLPPPYEYEYAYVRRRPVFWFYDPIFAFAPPPPCPVFFLPPPLPRAYFVPPPRPVFAYVLPVPVYVPVQSFVRPVRTVVRPPNNLIAVNIHQTVQAPPPGAVQGAPVPGPSGAPGAPVIAGTPGGPVVSGAPGAPAGPGAPGGPGASGSPGSPASPGGSGGPGGPSVGAIVGAGVVAGAAAGVLAARVALPASLANKAVATPPKPPGAGDAVSGAPVLQPGQGRPLLGSAPGTPTLAPGVKSATVPPAIIPPPSGAVQGAPQGSPQGAPSILNPKQATGTPPVQGGSTGAPQGTPQGTSQGTPQGTPQVGPTVLAPKQATGTPPPGAGSGAPQGGPSILAPKQATGTPPTGAGTVAGGPQGAPSILAPKQATGTPPPQGSGSGAPPVAPQGGPSIVTPKSATGTPAATPPPPPPRDTGAADRARAEQQTRDRAAEQQAQQAKDRAAEQQRAAQQQRAQEAQRAQAQSQAQAQGQAQARERQQQDEAARARRQREQQQQQQQQQDQQRRSEQQRQQQQAAAQAQQAQQARAAQAQQQAAAQARAAQQAQAQARAAQQAQQAQQAQAQAQAQARAAQAAAQQRAAQASRPKCGIQGTPPCPR